MGEGVLTMAEWILRINPDLKELTHEEQSKALDAEVERFSDYMATLGDWKAAGPLTPMERMLLKSFLVRKLTGEV